MSRQLALAALGFFSLGLPEGLLGVAWPSIRASFGLPLDALGLLLTTFATGYFVSSAASGWVIRRLGIGVALALSCGATGLALLGYSVAPVWLGMVALGAVVGLGAGTIDAGINTYAAMAHTARALNWLYAAFGIGAAVGPLVMTAILDAGLGWNLGYALVGLAQLTLASGYWLSRRRFAASAPPQETSAESSSTAALLRQPLAWISLALFFVYVGFEASAGQWTFSLFTLSRGAPTTVAGVLVSGYWAALTVGRILFGAVAGRVSSVQLLRVCMAVAGLAALVLWLNLPLLSPLSIVVIGLVFAPIFPVLISETPSRLGLTQTANAVGFQVAAAVLGGAAIPGLIGVLAAHINLEVIAPCFLMVGLAQWALYEALIRPVSGRPRSVRSQSSAAATAPPGA